MRRIGFFQEFISEVRQSYLEINFVVISSGLNNQRSTHRKVRFVFFRRKIRLIVFWWIKFIFFQGKISIQNRVSSSTRAVLTILRDEMLRRCQSRSFSCHWCRCEDSRVFQLIEFWRNSSRIFVVSFVRRRKQKRDAEIEIDLIFLCKVIEIDDEIDIDIFCLKYLK